MKNSITAVLVLLYTGLLGQPLNSLVNQVDLPTPQAASFGKFGEIPVNHSTGIPDITIPLYQLREGR